MYTYLENSMYTPFRKKISSLIQTQQNDRFLVFLFFRSAQQHCTSVPLKYSMKLLLMYFSKAFLLNFSSDILSDYGGKGNSLLEIKTENESYGHLSHHPFIS